MIDQKLIEGWKALRDRIVRGDEPQHRFVDAKLAGEALTVLLAEREGMLDLLREIQWGDRFMGQACCPVCGGLPPGSGGPLRDDLLGHMRDCRLAKAIGEEEG